MDQQNLFNVLVAISGALGGWWMRIMWQSLTDLRREDAKLADKVAAIEVLVAGKYPTRIELDKTLAALFVKLDRIEDKLSSKMDR